MADPVLDLQVEVAVRMHAPRERVFALLTDVEQVAGLGPEHSEARWAEGESLALGAVFHGRNRRGDLEWELPCRVVLLDPPAAFGWTVGDPDQPTTTWTYALGEDAGGTLVVQRVEHGPGWSYLRDACVRRPERAAELVAGRAAELEHNMRVVLEAVQARLQG